MANIPLLGILQGRLTPSPDGSIQFFPEDWQAEFPVAKKIGFDCVELLVKAKKYKKSPLWYYGGISELSWLSGGNRLYLPSVHGFYEKSDGYPMVLGSIINSAHKIGASVVLVSFFKENTLKTLEDKQSARTLLKRALSICKNTGVQIGIESEMPASELLDFVSSFNDPHIGVYYDIGNMASVGVDVPGEISLLGSHIVGVHVKDRMPNGGETVPLGMGCADIFGAFKALERVDYVRPFIIQGARSENKDDVVLNQTYFELCKYWLTSVYGGTE